MKALLYGVAVGIVGAGWLGGRELGREIGEKTAKAVPLAVVGALGIAAYKVMKK
jgi:hypothetical protein